MTKNLKIRPVDLGALQQAHETAKKQLSTDAKALTKAQDQFDRSKKEFEAADAALKQGFRAITS